MGSKVPPITPTRRRAVRRRGSAVLAAAAERDERRPAAAAGCPARRHRRRRGGSRARRARLLGGDGSGEEQDARHGASSYRPPRAAVSGRGRRPITTYLVEVISGSPIGPRACSFWVLMPISAPKPNSPPSVNRVEALTSTAAESTAAAKRRAAAWSSVDDRVGVAAGEAPDVVDRRRRGRSTTRGGDVEGEVLGRVVLVGGRRPRRRTPRTRSSPWTVTPASWSAVDHPRQERVGHVARARAATRRRCRRWCGGSWR